MRYGAKIGMHNKQRYVMPVSQTLLLQLAARMLMLNARARDLLKTSLSD